MIAIDQTMRLLDPWFLVLLLPLAVVVVLRLRRQTAALPAADNGLFATLPRTLRSRLTWLPPVLQALAATAFLLAMARPVTRDVVPISGKGVDIVLVLDTSSSMLATDMDDRGRLSRMLAARTRALDFVKARPTDRLGLITFAGLPDLRCPLTLDGAAVAAFLGAVEAHHPEDPDNGTLIGTALAKAVKLLHDSKADSKVIVLLSDGEATPGGIATEEAAKLAQHGRVRVHTIGLGRPVVHNTILGVRVQTTDFTALQEVAKTTGGRFFEARSSRDLGEVYASIDALEKVDLEDPRYRTVDWFRWPLWLGGGLLVFGLLLELAWIRRVP